MYWLTYTDGDARRPLHCHLCAFSGQCDIAAPAPLARPSAGAAALSCGQSDSRETLPKTEASPTERPTVSRKDQMEFHLPQRIKL